MSNTKAPDENVLSEMAKHEEVHNKRVDKIIAEQVKLAALGIVTAAKNSALEIINVKGSDKRLIVSDTISHTKGNDDKVMAKLESCYEDVAAF